MSIGYRAQNDRECTRLLLMRERGDGDGMELLREIDRINYISLIIRSLPLHTDKSIGISMKGSPKRAFDFAKGSGRLVLLMDQ